MLGISNRFRVAANIAVPASIVPVTSTLTIPVAANQVVHARYCLYFSVGAAGGGRFQITVPAAGVAFATLIKLFNTVAPALVTATQAASAAFTNAIANAGTHALEIEADIVNGVNAGNIDLTFAQNTSDATPITLILGSFVDVVYL